MGGDILSSISMPCEGLDALRSLAARAPGAAVTIGNFDGVHRGHRALVAAARERGAGRPVVAVTFDPPPPRVHKPEAAPLRLTPRDVKVRLLHQAGADEVLVLPPTPELLHMEAEAFFAVLRDDARVAHLVEGDGFCFGKGRRGTVGLLREWTRGTAMDLTVVPPVRVALLDATSVPVSSSLIRFLAAVGRVRDAGICLGSPLGLVGTVVEGFRRGRTIGFPTANLDCDGNVVPGDGVYAGRITLDGNAFPVALNVGPLPTFSSTARQIEAHIVGYSGDLYGRTLEVEVLDFVREARRFSGLDALKSQLARDVEIARSVADRVSTESPFSVSVGSA